MILLYTLAMRPGIKKILILIIYSGIGISLLLGLSRVVSSTNNEQTEPETTTQQPIASDAEELKVITTTVDPEILYSLINAYRTEEKLSELKSNLSLEKSANRKIQDMIDQKYWQHTDTKNIPSWYLFKQAGYDYILAGENLSFGYSSAWDVFAAWKESDIHRAELLKEEYQDMGLAIDCQTYKRENKPSCIVVLHLGKD